MEHPSESLERLKKPRGRIGTLAVVALVTTNPKVMKIANSLRWQPETLVRRGVSALPNVMEQNFYVEFALEFPTFPETLRTIFRSFLGHQEIQPGDIFTRKIGKNLVYNKVDEIALFAREVVTLTGNADPDFRQYRLTVQDACDLILHHGDAQRAADVLTDHYAELASQDRLAKFSDLKLRRMAVRSALRPLA